MKAVHMPSKEVRSFVAALRSARWASMSDCATLPTWLGLGLALGLGLGSGLGLGLGLERHAG